MSGIRKDLVLLVCLALLCMLGYNKANKENMSSSTKRKSTDTAAVGTKRRRTTAFTCSMPPPPVRVGNTPEGSADILSLPRARF